MPWPLYDPFASWRYGVGAIQQAGGDSAKVLPFLPSYLSCFHQQQSKNGSIAEGQCHVEHRFERIRTSEAFKRVAWVMACSAVCSEFFGGAV